MSSPSPLSSPPATASFGRRSGVVDRIALPAQVRRRAQVRSMVVLRDDEQGKSLVSFLKHKVVVRSGQDDATSIKSILLSGIQTPRRCDSRPDRSKSLDESR